MDTPDLEPVERGASDTFHALLRALSRPGTFVSWPGDAEVGGRRPAHRIAEALVDGQCRLYSHDDDLRGFLERLGGRNVTPDQAEFLFLDSEDPDWLQVVRQAAIGDWIAPEQGATLFLQVPRPGGSRARLTGPGVPADQVADLPLLPAAFWDERSRAIAPPLGWDLFLTTRHGVMGLPRTTRLEVLG